ncbi:hypothetical protein ACWCQW_37740 [Streptomyces mirabilis]
MATSAMSAPGSSNSAAHRHRLQLADPILLGELEAAGGGEAREVAASTGVPTGPLTR